MDKIRTLLITSLLLVIQTAWGQAVLPDLGFAQDFAAQVKSMDEFMARFNGDESKPGIHKTSLRRRDNILALFDFNIGHGNLTNNDFKKKLSDFTEAVCSWKSRLDLKDASSWAELLCSVKFNNKTFPVTLLMQKENIDNNRSRWAIVCVKGLKEAGLYNDKLSTISPVDHEVHFMGLQDFIQNNRLLCPSLRSKNKTIDTFSMFVGMLVSGNLHFVSINEVKFHFLAVPDYAFVVKEIGRNGPNSGWLISNFWKLDNKGKEKYENNLLGIDIK